MCLISLLIFSFCVCIVFLSWLIIFMMANFNFVSYSYNPLFKDQFQLIHIIPFLRVALIGPCFPISLYALVIYCWDPCVWKKQPPLLIFQDQLYTEKIMIPARDSGGLSNLFNGITFSGFMLINSKLELFAVVGLFCCCAFFFLFFAFCFSVANLLLPLVSVWNTASLQLPPVTQLFCFQQPPDLESMPDCIRTLSQEKQKPVSETAPTLSIDREKPGVGGFLLLILY